MSDVDCPELSSHAAEHKQILGAVDKIVVKLYHGEHVDSAVIDNFVAS